MKSRRSTLALAVLCLALGSVRAQAQPNALDPALSIDQQKLIEGAYPLWQVLQDGQQIFNVPFTPAGPDLRGDGLGEGHDGPRSFQRRAFNPYPWPVARTPLAGDDRREDFLYEFPFVKLNGLGATSCYDCHSSIGTWVEPGAKPVKGVAAMVRKPGTPGGAGGFSTNAFINSEYPARAIMLLRNPPHVFGTGYTNSLGTEMTIELQSQAESARLAAARQPGTTQSIALVAKGVAYGTFATTWNAGKKTFANDESGVVGVAEDLVVRPFQWKGIASSVRHFSRDALDFHFSMQAVEKVAHTDCDLDGKKNEIDLGDVAALAAYVTMTRPPQQQIPPGKEKIVARGEEVFRGQFSGASGAMCATCHVPSLTLQKAVLTIETPPIPAIKNENECPQEAASLVDPMATSNDLPSVRQWQALFPQVLKNPAVQKVLQMPAPTPQQIWAAVAPVLYQVEVPDLAKNNYQIDLSLAPSPDVPTYVFPRLPAAKDGSVTVPLFSDLKLHAMGEALQDPASQGTDVAGISIAPQYFLTRVLWGVGDTGPWLHDGRARDLREAILLHESPGSEANAVIIAFRKCKREDQEALIQFLLSLRLPVDEGISAHAYGS